MIFETTYNIRGVYLFIYYTFDKVFREVIITKVELQDSDEDIYELLGESDREELLIKCLENYQEQGYYAKD